MNKNIGVLLLALAVFFTALTAVSPASSVVASTQVYSQEFRQKYFQRDRVMEIDIQIAESDWQAMNAAPQEEQFYTAGVVVNGDNYSLVEVRAKGNSSLSAVARNESQRYSFKINFDSLVKGQTMAGLTQLNLNNNYSDASSMREYLSYCIYEEMGLPVPAFAYARVSINGIYHGLYLAVESILEPYLEYHFGDLTGDLYKSTGNTLAYIDEDPNSYSGLEVKSSIKNADQSKLVAMLSALNSSETTTAGLERVLNVDAALRYIAVSTALVNFDSYLGNFGHNYYLYEQNGVFNLLVWDLNMSFGGFGVSNLGGIYIDEPVSGALSSRPLVAKLLSEEEFLQRYHGYLQEIVDKYLSGTYLSDKMAMLKDMISLSIAEDPTAFFTYDEFEKALAEPTEEEIEQQLTRTSSEGMTAAPQGEVPVMPQQGVVQRQQNQAPGQERVPMMRTPSEGMTATPQGEAPVMPQQDGIQRQQNQAPGQERVPMMRTPSEGMTAAPQGEAPVMPQEDATGMQQGEIPGAQTEDSAPQQNQTLLPGGERRRFENDGMSSGLAPLTVARTMAILIQRQLDGLQPSTNNGQGISGGMAGGAMQIRIDRSVMDPLVAEVQQAGGITEEIIAKAAEQGIPEDILRNFAAMDQQGGDGQGGPQRQGQPDQMMQMGGGMMLGQLGEGGAPQGGRMMIMGPGGPVRLESTQQQQQNWYILAVCGGSLLMTLLVVWRFKRRRFVTLR